MKQIEKTRKVFNEETEQFDKEEVVIELIPDKGKCLRSKKTKHRFIHTIQHTGLTLTVRPSEVELYEEVAI